MSIHRKDFNAMTLNDLRQLLIDQAVENEAAKANRKESPQHTTE